jgi:hypothetical protein
MEWSKEKVESPQEHEEFDRLYDKVEEYIKRLVRQNRD